MLSTYQECCCIGWRNEHHKDKCKGKINDQIQIRIQWECILPGARNEHHTLLSVAGASTIPGSATSTTPPVFLSRKIQIQIKLQIWTHLFNCNHNIILNVIPHPLLLLLAPELLWVQSPEFSSLQIFYNISEKALSLFLYFYLPLYRSQVISVCLTTCRISQLLRLQVHQIFGQASSWPNFHEHPFFGEIAAGE